jgi:hypothetical protein
MEINLESNYNKLHKFYLETYFDKTRRQQIQNMYEDLGEKLYLAPASSVEHHHNAIPGGYLDHILRVTDYALEVYDMYKRLSLNVSDFVEENLVFVALHHDLGKLGFPGPDNEMYIPNPSDWHRKNLGQVYKKNDKIPFMLIQDQSLYLLQHYGINMSWVEYISIKVHDGLYDDTNKPYYITNSPQSKLISNLPFILHAADLMAAKYEYEQWRILSSNTPSYNTSITSLKSKKEPKENTFENILDADKMKNIFESIFDK